MQPLPSHLPGGDRQHAQSKDRSLPWPWLAGSRKERLAQPHHERELFVPARSAVPSFSALALQVQDGAVFAQPVSSLALRLKGVDIDDITVVTFQARSAGNYIFPINALPRKSVSLGGGRGEGRGTGPGLRVTQTCVYSLPCH